MERLENCLDTFHLQVGSIQWAIIHLLENVYELVSSHKVFRMIANDVVG